MTSKNNNKHEYNYPTIMAISFAFPLRQTITGCRVLIVCLRRVHTGIEIRTAGILLLVQQQNQPSPHHDRPATRPTYILLHQPYYSTKEFTSILD